MTVVLANTTLGNVSNISYLMWYFITAQPFILPTRPSYPEIHTVAGEEVTMPCNISQSDAENSASLILWYRGDSEIPFHTADARKTSLQEATHFCSPELANRTRFDLSSEPARLHIDPVLATDGGLYRCRVQFKKSSTVNNLIRLHVISPPQNIYIYDESGTQVNGLIGPYDEGSNVTITCVSIGGHPSPALIWWQGSSMKDNTYSLTASNRTSNTLDLQLTRKDFGAKYTCLSSNTNLTIPLSSSVTLDMNLNPLEVKITTQHAALYAGWQTVIDCESSGARPPAALTWWMNSEKLHSGNQTFTSNTTKSSLLFVPSPEDNGRVLSCRAENLLLQNSAIEYGWTVIVFYLPTLTLMYGAGIKRETITEGVDVYFDCDVDSNPATVEVEWYFGRHPLYSNTSAGIIISNQSLALRNVKPSQTGRYQCSAKNVVGQGWSDPIHLQVKYSPRCGHSRVKIILLSPGETTRLECDVDSLPEAKEFHWNLKSGGTSTDLHSSAVNYISYSSSQGYGEVTCWATNGVGLQVESCKMRIVKKDNETVLKGCSLSSNINGTLTAKCDNIPEKNPRQNFYVEVYESVSGILLANLSSGRNPAFLIRGIPPNSEVSLTMYASGPEGRSESSTFTLSTPTGRNATESQITKFEGIHRSPMASLLIILVAVFVLFLLIGCVVAIATRYYFRVKNKRGKHVTPNRSSTSFDENGSGCPDVIPNEMENRASFRRERPKSEVIELDQRYSLRNDICGRAVVV